MVGSSSGMVFFWCGRGWVVIEVEVVFQVVRGGGVECGGVMIF